MLNARSEFMKRPKLSTIFIGFGLFIFFLLLRFPYQNVRGWLFGLIYKNTGIYVLADEIYLSLFGWPGVGICCHSFTDSGLAYSAKPDWYLDTDDSQAIGNEP